MSFGTRPTERHQVDQVGTRKNRSERRYAWRSLVAVHQDGNFLLVPSRPRFALRLEFAETNTEPTEQSPPSGDPVAARADHRSLPPVILDVSPFSLAERTAFAGRETEGALIRAMIDRALSGHGSLIMLGGGPGVGKSRLAMEMTEYASHVGFKCLVGHCYERDEAFPYLPFVELIESSLAQAASLDDFRRRLGTTPLNWPSWLPAFDEFFRTFRNLWNCRRRRSAATFSRAFQKRWAARLEHASYVYILEDLHWADESTLALLIHLAQRVTQLPIVIIGTYRDGLSDSKPALIQIPGRADSVGCPPTKAQWSVKGIRCADVKWAKPPAGAGKSSERHI